MDLVGNTANIAKMSIAIEAATNTTITTPIFESSGADFSVGSFAASIATSNGKEFSIHSATDATLNAASIAMNANSITLTAQETLVLAASTVTVLADTIAITSPSTSIKADHVELLAGNNAFNLGKESVAVTAPSVAITASSDLSVEADTIKMQTDSSGSTKIELGPTSMTIKSDKKVTFKSATRTMDVDTVIAAISTMRQRVANLKVQLAAKKALLNGFMDTQDTGLASLETTYDAASVAQGVAEAALSNHLSTSEAELTRSEQDLESSLASEVDSVDVNSLSLEQEIQEASIDLAAVSDQELLDQLQVAAALVSLDSELSGSLGDLSTEQVLLGKAATDEATRAAGEMAKMPNNISMEASMVVASFQPIDTAVASLDDSIPALDQDMATLRTGVNNDVSALESTLAGSAIEAHVSKANALKADTAALSSGISKALPLAHIVDSIAVRPALYAWYHQL
jgi:hypothetical protein